MTIEIHRPELEALVRERMKIEGGNVEDVLMQALTSLPPAAEKDAGFPDNKPAAAGADLVAEMQASPCKEIDLVHARDRMPVRDVVF
jgi:hypothetical protein